MDRADRQTPASGPEAEAPGSAPNAHAGAPPADSAAAAQDPPPQDRPAPAPVEPAVFVPRITIGAFARDSGIRTALLHAASDRRMQRATMQIAEGDAETAIEHYRAAPTPDLIVVESRLDRAALFPALEHLAEQCPPGTRLIVIGHENDVVLYRQLLKLGVGDYLVAPLDAMALMDAVVQLYQEGTAERLGKVIAFLGARGGAGSSAVAQNVAAAMGGHCQASVLLLDLDLRFGSAALDLNLEPTQGADDALDEGENLDTTLLDRLVTPRDERIGVLASGCLLDRTTDPDPEALAHLIETARAIAPNVLLDLPLTWSPGMQRALFAADEIVLTAAPDLTALRNARNILAAARSARPNDPPPRLVLNQLGIPKRREVSPPDFRKVLELEPAAQIPHDAIAFGAAAASGQPVAETRGNAAAAEAFEGLARLLTGQKATQAERRGLGALARRLARKK